MIDEMTYAFDSPVSVSKVLIIILLSRDPKKMRGAEQGPQKAEMRRGFSALSSPSFALSMPWDGLPKLSVSITYKTLRGTPNTRVSHTKLQPL